MLKKFSYLLLGDRLLLILIWIRHVARIGRVDVLERLLGLSETLLTLLMRRRRGHAQISRRRGIVGSDRRTLLHGHRNGT